MFRKLLLATTFASLSLASCPAARADDYEGSAWASYESRDQGRADEAAGDDRMMVVNGNTGRVVYDDGHDDVVCIKRKKIVDYDWYGRPVYKRTVRCN